MEKTTTSVICQDHQIDDVVVSYTISKGRDATRDSPAEDCEVEVHSIVDKQGADWYNYLGEKELSFLADQIRYDRDGGDI
jgi:hypothetical protein